MIGLYWLKRDFRLLDNPALTLALDNCASVTMLYAAEPSMLKAADTSVFHLNAIQSAFNELQRRLKGRKGLCYQVTSELLPLLKKLYSLKRFDFLYSHEEIGFARTYSRDRDVARWCYENNVKWIEVQQTGVFRRLKNRDKRSKLWNHFYSETILPVPSQDLVYKLKCPKEWEAVLNTIPLNFKLEGHLPIKETKTALQLVSELNAHKMLKSFLHDRGLSYSGGISSPTTAMTAGSRMSTFLAWGSISGRYVYQKANSQKERYRNSGLRTAPQWSRSLSSFISRLHWRDHFIQRLESQSNMEFYALNRAYEQVEYANDENLLRSWLKGRTGFPMVDACMRCLAKTGFINFRMRALITSFACHVLHLDWRYIKDPMARLYADFEPGIHISQLQMQAGVVGINTIRVYNPTKQIIDQDPECLFIKKWISELSNFTSEEIIAHGKESLGKYPPQLVDYKVESKKMKDQLWSIKGKIETKQLAKKVYLKHGSRKRPLSKRNI